MKNVKELKKQNLHKVGVRKVELADALRKIPKRKGGVVEEDNLDIVHPIETMVKNKSYRPREDKMNKLKSLIDGREQLMKTYNGCNNRILAMERGTDFIDNETKEYLQENSEMIKKRLGKQDAIIKKLLSSMVDDYPIIDKALKIHGIGFITIAYLITYVNIDKARYASSLWAYVGLDKASHKRYEKNISSGGNKTLRTVLYNMAISIEKNRKCTYRVVYEGEKLKLAASEKITQTRNTQGHLISAKWKDVKPGHRRGAAIRKMIKHFLADFWYVWRTLEGLDTPLLYPEAKLDHKGIILPQERGWDI